MGEFVNTEGPRVSLPLNHEAGQELLETITATRAKVSAASSSGNRWARLS